MGRLALVGSRGILCGYEASCGPSSEALEQEEAGVCAGRGCTWRPPDQDQAAPPCFYPPGYGYHVAGEPVTTPAGLRVHLQKLGTLDTLISWPEEATFILSAGSYTMFGGDFADVTVDFEFQTSSRLRVKIYPSNVTRYRHYLAN